MLVAQLDHKDDLLASWMAHYIAELIDNVEKATPEAKPAAQEACFNAIMKLWRRQSSWPEKVRPFIKLEPVLRTLASLDLEQPTERYDVRERNDALAVADDETHKWLAFARDIDWAARFLIRTALRTATKSTAESMSPWFALAKNAEIDDSIETSLLKVIIEAEESGNDAKLRKASIHLRLSGIETFLKEGAAFADKLRTFLDDTSDGAAAKQNDASDGGEGAVESNDPGDHHSDG